jgi:GH25 family lysozyme M1 (1,4-beta-N-acetylmuramidase)
MNEDTATVPSLPRLPFALVLAVALLGSMLVLATPAQAAFPGTNGKIEFQSDRTGKSQLFTMNSDGTSQTQLTKVNSKNYDGAWYPDGTGLAYSSCCAPGTTQLELYALNANGSGPTRLTNNTTKDARPAWSPDGSQIAFVALRVGNKEIYVMNADGSGRTNLTNNSATDDVPAWSPDGTKIAFASTRSGSYDVWVMNADGSGLTRLNSRTAVDTDPSWSPDGTKIAFESDRTGNRDIFTINADGTTVKNITNNAAQDSRPAWSPDGSKIAFDSDRSGNYDIWTMKVDGTSPTNVTNNPAKDLRPDWQPVTAPTFQGIDVSHWQGTIDFDAVAGAGVRFVFAKATEGQTFNDPNYATYRADAAAAGLAFGAYHYARPDSSTNDAVLEADHFVDIALPASGDLLPVIDLEDAGGLSTSALTTWLWAFLGEVLAKKGVHALIYTSPSFWQTHLGDTDAFAKGGYSLLWIAHWFAPTPTVPGKNWGGYGWTFWQNSDCITVPGIGGCVDSDFFNGIILSPAEVP